MHTIAALRKKDPRVYDAKTQFYTSSIGEKKKGPVKDKEYRLKDYERDIITEHGGYVNEPERIEDDDDDDRRTKHITFSDEQDELKNELKKAAFGSDNEDEDEEDGFLIKREKTKEEATQEEEDYKTFLLNALNVCASSMDGYCAVRDANDDILFRRTKRPPRSSRSGTIRRTLTCPKKIRS